MKNFLLFLFFFICSNVKSQVKDSLKLFDNNLYVSESGTIPELGITLDEVILFQPLRFQTIEELKEYLILRNRTLKVYPYAKLASDRLKRLNERINSIKNNSSKRRYTKRIEKFIYSEFEEELKKLSRSQGRILIKLVHRQTGTTTHDLVKELRNGWRAFIYQTTASLFDLTLKDTFDPKANREDFMIEDILQRANSDNIIELDPTALTYNLDSLYQIWRTKKTDTIP
ncbi:MAG: hypothetical protein CMC88_07050 [Flavobacteriaceae bacterium]|nr:hypothetical protein [Flavobacteriaceae bacterium]|tara:strand:- start:5007 stop:5690 length:684 start_codon:yes stop_codon:yes gene_type:complete